MTWPEFQNLMVRLGAWDALQAHPDAQAAWFSPPATMRRESLTLKIELEMETNTRVRLTYRNRAVFLETVQESSFQTYHSPEFKVLCQRLGIPWHLPIRDVTIFVLSLPDRGLVQIFASFLGQDTFHDSADPAAATTEHAPAEQKPGPSDPPAGK